MLLSNVRKSTVRHGLLEKGDKVLVACSGGADSTALLLALLELSGEYDLRIAVAHFNHRLRRASDQDERFVIRLARKLGLSVYVKREDIRAWAKKHGQNIEEAGRERRYRFLRDTASRVGARKIATGHTLTDQAETVLMRLLRGTGPRGLEGIAPCVDNLIIRPLIDVERREVEAYLRSSETPHREDESNRNLGYLRNRVRRRLIPYLEKSFEPEDRSAPGEIGGDQPRGREGLGRAVRGRGGAFNHPEEGDRLSGCPAPLGLAAGIGPTPCPGFLGCGQGRPEEVYLPGYRGRPPAWRNKRKRRFRGILSSGGRKA